jgi:hypothetical protein
MKGRGMNEDQFDQSFVWYEWSFVSPDDVPSDDLQVTGSASGGMMTATDTTSGSHGDRWVVQDYNWRWTT